MCGQRRRTNRHSPMTTADTLRAGGGRLAGVGCSGWRVRELVVMADLWSSARAPVSQPHRARRYLRGLAGTRGLRGAAPGCRRICRGIRRGGSGVPLRSAAQAIRRRACSSSARMPNCRQSQRPASGVAWEFYLRSEVAWFSKGRRHALRGVAHLFVLWSKRWRTKASGVPTARSSLHERMDCVGATMPVMPPYPVH